MADIKIYGTLKNATESNKIALASQVYDEAQEKFQSEINQEIKSAIPPKLRVASWNIGGFSLGTSGVPSITPADEAEMSAKWHTALNELGADLLCTCEYNTEFMDAQEGYPAINARDEIFTEDIFKYAAIGPKLTVNRAMQTAIFANMLMSNQQKVDFPQTTQAGRYYEVVDIYIAGKLVKVAAIHLDFNQGSTDAEKEQSHLNRIAQINKLITDFSAYPYVILAGDYNISIDNTDDYDYFKNAGYGMVNHAYCGDILTYPAGDAARSPLDNIVYKGFVSHKVDTLNDDTLSDHMSIFAELTMIL